MLFQPKTRYRSSKECSKKMLDMFRLIMQCDVILHLLQCNGFYFQMYLARFLASFSCTKHAVSVFFCGALNLDRFFCLRECRHEHGIQFLFRVETQNCVRPLKMTASRNRLTKKYLHCAAIVYAFVGLVYIYREYADMPICSNYSYKTRIGLAVEPEKPRSKDFVGTVILTGPKMKLTGENSRPSFRRPS